MEETLKNVFSVLLSIIILFLFPMYITFEQRDNIAYSMAIKITHNFVENVRNKGYISSKMYSDFESNLLATGNTYEIKMEHRSNKVYPYENSYKVIQEIYTEKQIIPIISKDNKINYFFNMNSSEYMNINLINELNHGFLYMYSIVDVLQYDDETKIPIYPMNVGDIFNITVKNTNTSIATKIFQILTGNIDDNNNVRVYVNYGGIILNEEYLS